MIIKKLVKGTEKDTEIAFAEIGFGDENGDSFVFCIESGDLCLLVYSEHSMFSIAEDLEIPAEHEITFIINEGQNEVPQKQILPFSCEDLLAYCMESELERYECWRDDGGEGIYEASESENGIKFEIAYDFMYLNSVADNEALSYLYQKYDKRNSSAVKQ